MKLCLVRHAPLPAGLGLAGRRDLDAVLPPQSELAPLAAHLAGLHADQIWTSPARRCQQTAAALGLSATPKPLLWEQDFGLWEGPDAVIPDLGPLDVQALAAHRPPSGESFDEMAARVCPELLTAQGCTLIVAHAGTVRAALSLVTGPAALSFSIAPLSLTIIEGQPGAWAVQMVNWTFP